MSDENVLLMVSYFKGGCFEVFFFYWLEVMIGFEYMAVIGMFYEGMEVEGLEVIWNIRSCYDGSKCNFFDEVECGYYYVWVMVFWVGILV